MIAKCLKIKYRFFKNKIFTLFQYSGNILFWHSTLALTSAENQPAIHSEYLIKHAVDMAILMNITEIRYNRGEYMHLDGNTRPDLHNRRLSTLYECVCICKCVYVHTDRGCALMRRPGCSM